MIRAQAQRLSGDRLHLHHGPIDMICQAWGKPADVDDAYHRATLRFDGLLEELVAELPSIRSENAALFGGIARKMNAAVAPYRPLFITPMAAVAGAVADTILHSMKGDGITRAYANNGGDIAVHLTPGQSLTCAIAKTGIDCTTQIAANKRARGIATSGWRGRSWSRGIADAVTVLARTAAAADAAATMIANAVDLPHHPAIQRRPAHHLQADTDLGARLVTVEVAHLTPTDVATALSAGLVAAQQYFDRGLIEGAAIFLQGEMRTLNLTLGPAQNLLLPKETAIA